MKRFVYFLVLGLLLVACAKEEDPTPITKYVSKETTLNTLNINVDGSIYPLYANDEDMSYLTILPPGVNQITIEDIEVSAAASIDVSTGDEFTVDQFPIQVTVTAEDSVTTKSYILSFMVASDSLLVHKHGLLKARGNKLVDKHNQVVSFAGNSFFWSNDGWGSEDFYNADVVKWLKDDWNTTIIRAALGVDEWGGYVESKEANKARIVTLIEAAIQEGIYVIIDWHSHHAEDYSSYAGEFFSEISRTYGKYENIIYEIYNEPLDVSWTSVLKPYATSVISSIRLNNSPNLIVVGTPEWSQRVDLASSSPITGSDNIAYCLHFYTVHHQQWLRDKADIALKRNVALVVTEWGSLGYTQDDPETEKWMDWCRDNDITHCNWAVNAKDEEWSIVRPGADPTGGWSEDDLTDAGKLAKSIIKNWPN